jgi:leucyl aminopeptidase
MALDLAVRAADPSAVKTPLLALLLPAGNAVPAGLKGLDAALGGALTRALKRGDFRGGRDETMHLQGREGGAERVLLVGLGKPKSLPLSLRRAGALTGRQAHKLGAGQVTVWTQRVDKAGAEAIGIGLNLGCWEYQDLRTPPAPDERRAPLTAATILAPNNAAMRGAATAATAIGSGYEVTRRLAMMPGNLCTPDFLADTARDIGKRHRMAVTVLGRKEMEK